MANGERCVKSGSDGRAGAGQEIGMRRTVVRPNALRLFLLLPALVLSGGAAWAAKSPSPPASDAGYCQHVENPAARASCFESLKQLASGNVLLSLTLMRKAAAASPKSGIIEMLSGKYCCEAVTRSPRSGRCALRARMALRMKARCRLCSGP